MAPKIKYVPVTETYGQMQSRLNRTGPIQIPDAFDPKNHIYYYTKTWDKVGEYRYLGDEINGNLSLSDGKKTCVVEHSDKTLTRPYLDTGITAPPIKFDYCYEDKRK